MQEQLYTVLREFVLKYGYLGAFIASIAGNVIPFFPVPYLIFIILLASVSGIELITLSIISGLGAAVGKLLPYLLGRFGVRRLVSEETRKSVDTLKELIDRYGFIAVALVAATPLPDDVVLIPVGMMKYSALKYFLSCMIGKIALTLLTVYSYKGFEKLFKLLIGGEGGLNVSIVSIAVFLILTIMILRINWVTFTNLVRERGLLEAIRSLPHLFRRKI